ncbi:MAG: rRNA maturation RNase YbeY [Alphaproteobacteria bacterium]|jgi:probable rRNA maturation factor
MKSSSNFFGKINILVENKLWLKKTSKPFIKNVASLVCQEQANALATFKKKEFNLVLSDSERIKGINNQFRGKNKETNVLSFSYIHDESFDILGECIFSLEVIENEAREQNKSFEHHFAHMIIHGILHILGYDHERSNAEAKIMEGVEIKLLKKLGIKNPYTIL